MSDLSTREILENMFNGTTAIKNQNPRFGQKEYYYINPYRDKYSSQREMVGKIIPVFCTQKKLPDCSGSLSLKYGIYPFVGLFLCSATTSWHVNPPPFTKRYLTLFM